jgi:IMP dehydrogenase
MASSAKAAFFDFWNKQGIALTFDDVRLRTIVLPDHRLPSSEIEISSRFSRNVHLKVPIVSSPMDTVTESDMAIAMAMLGGLGIIHGALSAENQLAEVKRVKLHRNGLIEKPISVNQNDSVGSVESLRKENKFEFSTFPVIDDNGKFVGMFTRTDGEFCADKSESVKQHMTPLAKIIYGPPSVTPSAAFDIMRHNGKLNTLPLLAEDGRVVGLYVKSDVLRVINDNPKNYNLDENGRLRVGAAVSTDPEEAVARVASLEKYIDVIVIDTANGNSKYTYETLKRLKKVTDIDIVVGNVSEGHSARLLAEAGADGIRVGQGGGSICTTRKETGIGAPQVTAVYECSRAVEDFGIPVCADGGLKDKGDIPIAFAAGAESVMMGNMLAATKESPGNITVLDNGSIVMEYRGMGSPSALRENAASRKRYGLGSGAVALPEGVEAQLPYKGSVHEVLPIYSAALRKSMEYIGAPDIKSLREDAQFWRITNAGLRESHPHDL